MPGSLLDRNESLRSDRSDASSDCKKVSFNRSVKVKKFPNNQNLEDRDKKFWFRVYKNKGGPRDDELTGYHESVLSGSSEEETDSRSNNLTPIQESRSGEDIRQYPIIKNNQYYDRNSKVPSPFLPQKTSERRSDSPMDRNKQTFNTTTSYGKRSVSPLPSYHSSPSYERRPASPLGKSQQGFNGSPSYERRSASPLGKSQQGYSSSPSYERRSVSPLGKSQQSYNSSLQYERRSASPVGRSQQGFNSSPQYERRSVSPLGKSQQSYNSSPPYERRSVSPLEKIQHSYNSSDSYGRQLSSPSERKQQSNEGFRPYERKTPTYKNELNRFHYDDDYNFLDNDSGAMSPKNEILIIPNYQRQEVDEEPIKKNWNGPRSYSPLEHKDDNNNKKHTFHNTTFNKDNGLRNTKDYNRSESYISTHEGSSTRRNDINNIRAYSPETKNKTDYYSDYLKRDALSPVSSRSPSYYLSSKDNNHNNGLNSKDRNINPGLQAKRDDLDYFIKKEMNLKSTESSEVNSGPYKTKIVISNSHDPNNHTNSFEQSIGEFNRIMNRLHPGENGRNNMKYNEGYPKASPDDSYYRHQEVDLKDKYDTEKEDQFKVHQNTKYNYSDDSKYLQKNSSPTHTWNSGEKLLENSSRQTSSHEKVAGGEFYRSQGEGTRVWGKRREQVFDLNTSGRRAASHENLPTSHLRLKRTGVSTSNLTSETQSDDKGIQCNGSVRFNAPFALDHLEKRWIKPKDGLVRAYSDVPMLDSTNHARSKSQDSYLSSGSKHDDVIYSQVDLTKKKRDRLNQSLENVSPLNYDSNASHNDNSSNASSTGAGSGRERRVKRKSFGFKLGSSFGSKSNSDENKKPQRFHRKIKEELEPSFRSTPDSMVKGFNHKKKEINYENSHILPNQTSRNLFPKQSDSFVNSETEGTNYATMSRLERAKKTESYSQDKPYTLDRKYLKSRKEPISTSSCHLDESFDERQSCGQASDTSSTRGGLAAAYQARQRAALRRSVSNAASSRSHSTPPVAAKNSSSSDNDSIHRTKERKPLVMYIPGVSHEERLAEEDDRASGITVARTQSILSSRPPKFASSRAPQSRSTPDLRRRNSIPKNAKFPWFKWKIKAKPKES